MPESRTIPQVGELVGELEPPEGWWHDVVTAIRDEYGD